MRRRICLLLAAFLFGFIVCPVSSQTVDRDPCKIFIDSIEFSTFIVYDKDHFMYHPVKIFDGDPTSAWLEESDGPGLGEFVEIKFSESIEADSLEIMPGLFDSRWYKQNHRLKSVTVSLDDRDFTFDFDDEMRSQRREFGQVIQFQRFKIRVVEVYPSSKWDDTAISEISFYLGDDPICVSLERVRQYLQVKTTYQAIKDELIESGIDVSKSDVDGITLLMSAASQRNEKIVELLIKSGAELNVQDNYFIPMYKGTGWTALMYAATRGYIEVVKLLLDAGADPSIKNEFDKTAKDIAAEEYQTETVELLDHSESQK